jgi:hypothetical protein
MLFTVGMNPNLEIIKIYLKLLIYTYNVRIITAMLPILRGTLMDEKQALRGLHWLVRKRTTLQLRIRQAQLKRHVLPIIVLRGEKLI